MESVSPSARRVAALLVAGLVCLLGPRPALAQSSLLRLQKGATNLARALQRESAVAGAGNTLAALLQNDPAWLDQAPVRELLVTAATTGLPDEVAQVLDPALVAELAAPAAWSTHVPGLTRVPPAANDAANRMTCASGCPEPHMELVSRMIDEAIEEGSSDPMLTAAENLADAIAEKMPPRGRTLRERLPDKPEVMKTYWYSDWGKPPKGTDAEWTKFLNLPRYKVSARAHGLSRTALDYARRMRAGFRREPGAAGTNSGGKLLAGGAPARFHADYREGEALPWRIEDTSIGYRRFSPRFYAEFDEQDRPVFVVYDNFEFRFSGGRLTEFRNYGYPSHDLAGRLRLTFDGDVIEKTQRIAYRDYFR